jgi:two-component system, NarL family, nitrate/nitrite response regulator NarL
MVRVVVGDDHPLYRDGVVRALVSSGRVDVVAEAADGAVALELIRAHSPDVAVLDYRMPILDGTQVAAAVRRDNLRTRVLLVSAYDEPPIVYHALQQGASGFLAKETSRSELVTAVLDCAKGEDVLTPGLATGLMQEIRRHSEPAQRLLSSREQQVLDLIARGRSIAGIAEDLFISPSTVKTHIQRLYEKLDVRDRGSAVAEAMRRGLVE